MLASFGAALGSRTIVAVVAILSFSAAVAQAVPAPPQQSTSPDTGQQTSPLPQGSATRGRKLFQGTLRFQNRGPACGSCHRSAGIAFPNGGTLGPDLTGIYERLGPEAMTVILQTLYFPTMNPIFANRPITPQEQSDLMAFFQQSGTGPPPAVTGKIGAIAVFGLILLLAFTGAIWRDRTRNVRKSLVQAGLGKGAGRA